MKLYIKILVFAAIVAGINACNKETVEVPIGEDMEMTVEATFPNVVWEAGDQISLLYGKENLALTGKTAGEVTEFSGTVSQLPSGEKYIAVYPYNEAYKLDGRSFIFTLPKEPKLIRESSSQTIGTSLLTGEHIRFQHATSYLGFEITRDDINSIMISSEGKHLSGTFKATVLNSGATTIAPVEGQTFKEITITKPLTGKYYVPVYPDRYNRIRIKLRSMLGSGEIVIDRPLTLNAGESCDLGEIDENIEWEKVTMPTVAVHATTSSTASISWSVSNFMSPETDNLYDWSVGLYKDSSLSDLVVSWDIPSSVFTYPEGSIYNIEGMYSPRFMFTGLDPDTEYFASVWKTSDPDQKTKALSVKTLTTENALISETAGVAGDIVLAEDFSELVWGGDIAGRFWGYSDNNRGSATALNKALGENPSGQKIINGFRHDFYLVNPYVGIGLFNTLGKAIRNTRLAEWESISEDNSDGKVCGCAGYVRLGTGDEKGCGGIVTPVLSNITGKTSVKVSFNAHPFRLTATDKARIKVMSIKADESSISAGGTIKNYTESSSTYLTVSENLKWTEYSCEITLEGNERIAIYVQRPEGTATGACRVLVDDIKVQLL